MSFVSRFVITMAAFASGTAVWADPDPVRFAVCGDSISTGAATHPNLEFDSVTLWGILNGTIPVTAQATHLSGIESVFPAGNGMTSAATVLEDSVVPPPRRAWPTVKEYRSSVEWVALGLLRSLSESYLDTEEFSWGYMLGRTFKVAPGHVLIAAENGARTSAATAQMARILDATGGELPEKIFMFFTGNDICAPRLEGMTPAVKFEQNLFKALHHALRNGRVPAGGTDIYVPAYVNVTQLLTSPAIQTKLVRAFGTKIACGQLRENQFVQVLPPAPKEAGTGIPPEANLISQVLPPNPAAMCPTLFARDANSADQSERIGALANRIREFRTAAQNAVRRASSLQKDKYPENPVRLHFIEETANLDLEADDVAEDCFHLSIRGQAKLARVIYDAEVMRPVRAGGE